MKEESDGGGQKERSLTWGDAFCGVPLRWSSQRRSAGGAGRLLACRELPPRGKTWGSRILRTPTATLPSSSSSSSSHPWPQAELASAAGSRLVTPSSDNTPSVTRRDTCL